MVEHIEELTSELEPKILSNLRSFCDGKIHLSEPGATDSIAPHVAELTGRRRLERTRIELMVRHAEVSWPDGLSRDQVRADLIDAKERSIYGDGVRQPTARLQQAANLPALSQPPG